MKGIRLGLLLITALAVSLLMALAAPVASGNGVPAEGNVKLLCGTAYWASYQDYLDRLLSVDYTVANQGTGPVYNTTIRNAVATSGVGRDTIVPIWMGDMAVGQNQPLTIQWNVPMGTTHFHTTLNICNDCHESTCVDGVNGGADIKPGSCPNSINLNNHGNVAVGVFSLGEFDARTIDRTTAMFAGVAPLDQGESPQDLNGDGLLDVVFHFDTESLNLQAGDTRACLTGELTTGGSFRSCDMVRIL